MMLQEDRGAGIPPLSSMTWLLPWRKQLELPGRTVILHLSSSDTNYNLILNSLIPRLLMDGGESLDMRLHSKSLYCSLKLFSIFPPALLSLRNSNFCG